MRDTVRLEFLTQHLSQDGHRSGRSSGPFALAAATTSRRHELITGLVASTLSLCL
jgi:hypothetical protein